MTLSAPAAKSAPGPSLRKIVSGGQTGADQAGLRAAKALGFETGGWMPYRFKTEAGLRPEFAELYGMQQTGRDPRYATRTRRNVRDSDATVWFGGPDSKGYGTTRDAVKDFGKPAMPVIDISGEIEAAAAALATYLQQADCRVLNVAGHRESTCPGIGDFAEAVLLRALGVLRRASEPVRRPAERPRSLRQRHA